MVTYRGFHTASFTDCCRRAYVTSDVEAHFGGARRRQYGQSYRAVQRHPAPKRLDVYGCLYVVLLRLRLGA
jgi:hypothetical protein